MKFDKTQAAVCCEAQIENTEKTFVFRKYLQKECGKLYGILSELFRKKRRLYDTDTLERRRVE